MGFLDNLKEIGEGLVDVVTAPVGLIVDTAKAWTSSEYNPGFEGTFGKATGQLVEGLGKVGGGLQFDEAGRIIGESQFGDAARELLKQAELIYSTEYQFQTGEAPLQLGNYGFQPGDISLQRGGSAALGFASNAIRGDIEGAQTAWRKSAHSTPGQALIEGLIDFHSRNPREQEQIRQTPWYNLVSGTTDAVARWFTDPGVILGKGLKHARKAAFTFDPVKRLNLQVKDIKRKFGPVVESQTTEVGGVKMAPLAEDGTAYVVVRNATAGKMREEGSLNVPKGADPELDEVIDLVGPDIGSQFVGSQNAHAGLLAGHNKTPTGVRYAGSDYRPVYLFGGDERNAAMRYASELHKKSPDDPPIILEIDTNGLPVALESIKDPTGLQPNGFFTLANQIPESNIRQVVRPSNAELDPALRIGEGEMDWEGDVTRLDETLYSPDGTPYEPDDIIRFEEFAEDIDTALRIGANNPVDAEKFLINRRNQRLADNLPAGGNIYDAAMNHRVVQQFLNMIDGMDALDIRLQFFPDNPTGPMLSNLLADAKTHADRRTILMAAMGYKMPEFATLEPMARAKIGRILDEMERVKSGAPPDERLRAMLGEPNRFNDMSPEGLDRAAKEAMGELEDQATLGRLLDSVAYSVDELRLPVLRRGTAKIRKSAWYQESSLARPIRVVSEWKAHHYINTNDPQSDMQIKRQMDEAAPLGVTAEEQTAIWTKYTNAKTHQARMQIVSEMETLIVEKAAAKAGMTADELDEVLREFRYGRERATEYLNSRRYASGDNDLVPIPDPDSGALELKAMPILDTQASPWLVLQNVTEIKRAASRFKRLRRAGMHTGAIMEQFNQLWKPTVLLRGGWPIRVVADEQLRILALTGSLVKHLAAISAGGTTPLTGIFAKNLTGAQRMAEGFALLTGTRPLTALGTQGARVTTAVAQKAKAFDPDWWGHIHEIGVEKYVSARSGGYGPNEQILHSMQALMGRDEMTLLDHLYTRSTGQWRSYSKGEALYGNVWARVLSDQFGRSNLGRQVVKELLEHTRGGLELTDAAHSQVIANVKRWMKTSPEGRDIVDRVPWRSNDLDRWVSDLIEELDGYTGHFDDALMDGILNNKITKEMMENLDERFWPETVHGEIVDQAIGQGPVVDFVRDLTSTTFDLLGRLPTDTLSRQPLFKHLYANEMVRLRDLHLAQGFDEIDESTLLRMSTQAREQSVVTTKKYLYDLAETSQFGYMMRYIMPFYPAWQEVMKVWGTFVLEDPSIAARARILWEAPNKANLVVQDDDGEEYLQFRLSEDAAKGLGLTGWAQYLATGGIRVGKSSFNLALNNPLPSVGPLIQMPLNEVVKQKPELEEALQFLLPFGVNVHTDEIWKSPLVRSIESLLGSPQSDDDYQKAFSDALSWMDVQYRTGERTTGITLEEAHDVAKKLTFIRLMSRLASPAQPVFDSPLKPYADTYRQLIEEHGSDKADEIFLNNYGQEYFAVTLSRTISETGISPTVEGEMGRQQFEDLIKKYPEYGRLIIGDEALGEFSMAAFARQLSNPVDPENPFAEPERVYREAEIDPRTGRIIDIDRRIGWQEYIKAMDQVDLYRRQMGLPNLRVREAEVLRQAKQHATQELAKQYPAWWEDFNSRNELKWDQRIDALRDISKDDNLINRPDMDGLSDYLQAREAILQELNRRKTLGAPSTLDASGNADLQGLWEGLVAQILDENIAFQPLYYRYLEGDSVRLRSGPSTDN